MSRLFVGNVAYKATSEDLKRLFGSFGEVTKVDIITEKVTNRPRGFAFVTFAKPEDAQRAMLELDGQELKGREIRVSTAKEKARA